MAGTEKIQKDQVGRSGDSIPHWLINGTDQRPSQEDHLPQKNMQPQGRYVLLPHQRHRAEGQVSPERAAKTVRLSRQMMEVK